MSEVHVLRDYAKIGEPILWEHKDHPVGIFTIDLVRALIVAVNGKVYSLHTRSMTIENEYLIDIDSPYSIQRCGDFLVGGSGNSLFFVEIDQFR